MIVTYDKNSIQRTILKCVKKTECIKTFSEIENETLHQFQNMISIQFS